MYSQWESIWWAFLSSGVIGPNFFKDNAETPMQEQAYAAMDLLQRRDPKITEDYLKKFYY